MNEDIAIGCFWVGIIGFITAGVVAAIVGLHFDTTGVGHHTGFITAVQQEGIFFQNYHVFVKTDNSSSQEDEYCVMEGDKALADQLQQFSKDRTLVSVTFKGVKGFGFNLCHEQQITAVSQDKLNQ